MPSFDALDRLAADERYVDQVRQLGRDLVGHVRDHRQVTALMQYGPKHPGVALRLPVLARRLPPDLPQELVARVARLAGRVAEIDQAG